MYTHVRMCVLHTHARVHITHTCTHTIHVSQLHTHLVALQLIFYHHTHMHTHGCTCMHVYMCTHAHTCTYTHVYTLHIHYLRGLVIDPLKTSYTKFEWLDKNPNIMLVQLYLIQAFMLRIYTITTHG